MNDRNMLTAVEVLEAARRLGAPTALQTFWKYIRLGLLPKGRKLPGHGNCSYFPPDTSRKIELIHRLSREFKLAGVVRAIRFIRRQGAATEPLGSLSKLAFELARGSRK